MTEKEEERHKLAEEIAGMIKPKEDSHMGDHDRNFCPECMKKDNAKELADRDHRDELKEKDQRIDTLEQAVQQAQVGHTHFNAEDYENCPNCGPELQKYVNDKAQRAIVGLSADDVRKLMAVHKIEPMPDRITIGPNLAKRLQRGD